MATVSPNLYWIGLSDGQYVAMSEDRLNKLMNAMPILRCLLFGHPQMQAKPLTTLSDGTTKIVEIPEELGVSKESFVLLVNCAFGVEPLPPRKPDSRLKELVETMTTLGGCVSLEERLSDLAGNPLKPEEDTEDRFQWKIIDQSQYRQIDYYKARDIAEAGFSATTIEYIGSNKMHYFRKPNLKRHRN